MIYHIMRIRNKNKLFIVPDDDISLSYTVNCIVNMEITMLSNNIQEINRLKNTNSRHCPYPNHLDFTPKVMNTLTTIRQPA
jgi:hypothetical protein